MAAVRFLRRLCMLAAAGMLVSVLNSCAGIPPGAPVASKPGTTTTIILVRHGERDEGFNPPLNEAGVARAQALVDVLGDSSITAIYAPELIRNLQTAQPLADHLGLTVQRVALVRLLAPAALARELVTEILERYPGEVVLYVGNDSNLEAIYAYLGGTGEPPVRHQDLYTAVISDAGDVEFIEATYGESR